MPLNKRLTSLSPQPSLASAGTAQQIISTALESRTVIIYAAKTNTGAVYLGDSNANAKAGTGINLAAGEAYAIEGALINGTHDMIDLSSIYFDGANSNDKLVVHYLP